MAGALAQNGTMSDHDDDRDEDELRTEQAPGGRPWRYRTTTPAIVVALISLLALAAAPLGWRGGWWHLRISFDLLMLGAALAVLGAVLAAIALLFLRRGLGRLHLALLAAAFLLGAAFVVLPLKLWLGHAPGIHDITTDTVNPPAFLATLPARRAEQGASEVYGGAAVAAAQRAAYPDIAPLIVPLAPAPAFDLALATARAMPRWTIVATTPPGSGGEAGRIEASAASFWFGFVDDVVIRVAPEGVGSRIDIRSLSRQGRGDLGVNAARVRAYLAALKRALTGSLAGN
jgi:uncharacterized protein (DUF1499 family)